MSKRAVSIQDDARFLRTLKQWLDEEKRLGAKTVEISGNDLRRVLALTIPALPPELQASVRKLLN